MTYQLKLTEGPGGLSFSLNFINHDPTCFSSFDSLINGNMIDDHGNTKIQNLNVTKILTYMSGYQDLEKSIAVLQGIPYFGARQLVTKPLPAANSPSELLAICENFVSNLHLDLESESSSSIQALHHNSG